MEKMLPRYALVEVAKLSHPPEHYDGWNLNSRPPEVGDRGAIVETLQTDGHIVNIVEAVAADGTTAWLSDFEPDEVCAVNDAG